MKRADVWCRVLGWLQIGGAVATVLCVYVLWSVFFLVPTGRGKAEDMISAHEHERVLRWLARLSTRVPYDIKTTEAQHYRRVVLQEKWREDGTKGVVDYADALVEFRDLDVDAPPIEPGPPRG